MNKQVSVIIPNYNYARFLQRRIDFIVNQTIKPAEIIFLDDCSSDDSLKVAEEILSKTDIPYQIIANETNQGVFKQWLKGIELIQYDYFWIAEADDYCELNFLETLLPAFDDKDVVMANSESILVDNDFIALDNSISIKNKYLDSSVDWSLDFEEVQDKYINDSLLLDNSIYNVSSVVFKKSLVDLDHVRNILNYKVCGDWLFYILSLNSYSSNKIFHLSKFLNYHVIHLNSVFGGLNKNALYSIETLRIYNYILENYCLNDERKNKILIRMINVYLNYEYSSDLETDLHKVSKFFSSNFYKIFHILFNQKEDGIKWLEGQVENYKLSLNQKEDGIKWLEGQVENYKLALNQKEDGIKWLEGQVENYKLNVIKQDEIIKNNSLTIEQQRFELDVIYSSFSWRVTKIFRFIKRIFK